MSKNTNADYYEGDVKETEEVITSAIEMQELVEQKVESRPVEEGTKTFRDWRKDTNALIDIYNSSFGKIYNHVK